MLPPHLSHCCCVSVRDPTAMSSPHLAIMSDDHAEGRSGGEGTTLVRVYSMESRGRGYVVEFQDGRKAVVPWSRVVAIRDPEASIPIFDYAPLASLPHLQGDYRERTAQLSKGLLVPSLSQPPSLGHLVALCRYFIRKIEEVCSEQDPEPETTGEAADATAKRRTRIASLGYVTESALWMLAVNALVHEERGPETGGGAAPVGAVFKLHKELEDLFDTRLGKCELQELLAHAEAEDCLDMKFLRHLGGLIEKHIESARDSREDSTALVAKRREDPIGDGRPGVGPATGYPLVARQAPAAQLSDMSTSSQQQGSLVGGGGNRGLLSNSSW
ncbi:unnamed protein product [Discosporangium mesarthrocarpum]